MAEGDVGRKEALHVSVQADVVTHVDEYGAGGRVTTDHRQRLVKREVGGVRLDAQGVDDEQRHSVKFFNLEVADALAVGDIRHVADAVAQDGDVVHHLDGRDLDALAVERRAGLHGMQLKLRCPRITVLTEAVAQLMTFQCVEHVGRAVDWQRLFTECKRPEAVESSHVVVVDMGDEQRIEFGGTGAEHLVAEVGTAVDEDGLAVMMHNGRLPQSLVAAVIGVAYWAFTA